MESFSDSASSSAERVWFTRFEEALNARRLAASTASRYHQIATHFFMWWCAHHPSADVSTVVPRDVAMFLKQHLPRCRCVQRCRRTIHENRAALRHLWNARPELAQEVAPLSPVHAEIALYERYLREVCGAATATRVSRVRYVGAFLQDVFGDGPIDRTAISAATVHGFVLCLRLADGVWEREVLRRLRDPHRQHPARLERQDHVLDRLRDKIQGMGVFGGDTR